MKLFDSISKQFHMDDSQQRKAECLWLWQQVKKHRGFILFIGLLGLLGTLMSLASSVASKYLIDAVTGSATNPILPAALMMAAMLLGSLILQTVSARINARVHVKVRNQMQHTTFGRILNASWQSLEAYRSGDLMNRLNSDINTAADGVIGFLPSLVASGIQFLGAFCIMLYYDPIMALIALLSAPVTLLAGRLVMGQLRENSLHMKDLTGQVMSFQEDSFRNLSSIKAFSVTDSYSRQMQALQGKYAEAYISFHNLQIRLSTCLSLISMLVTGACFGWGVYQLWACRITYGSLTLFLALAGSLRGAFSALVSLAQQLISLTTSAGRIQVVEALPAEDTAIPEGFDRETHLHILLEQVSFHYQNGDIVLSSFDFTAHPGDQIAITGPSGEGKTTLLRLLLGLVEPCSGNARFQGEHGSYPVCAGTRSAFAYVPQGNSIFTGTIAENLRIIAPDASEAEMEQALKLACAWEFVSQLPDGLNHPLGAGGRGISEGQAQRLAIARALLRKAPILLLDEATSGLDMETERQLMENLRSSSLVRTCILVTHRPGSANFCNRCYEIRQGQVSEVPHGA